MTSIRSSCRIETSPPRSARYPNVLCISTSALPGRTVPPNLSDWLRELYRLGIAAPFSSLDTPTSMVPTRMIIGQSQLTFRAPATNRRTRHRPHAASAKSASQGAKRDKEPPVGTAISNVRRAAAGRSREPGKVPHQPRGTSQTCRPTRDASDHLSAKHHRRRFWRRRLFGQAKAAVGPLH